MGIFVKQVTPEVLNDWGKNTLVGHLGIHIIEVGEQTLSATMPVDSRTHQPMGILHGGASVAMAETLGSLAAHLCLSEDQVAVGLEINANHIKSVKSGLVKGTASPVHIGNRTQVWEIRIVNEQNALVCVSRITMAILPKST